MKAGLVQFQNTILSHDAQVLSNEAVDRAGDEAWAALNTNPSLSLWKAVGEAFLRARQRAMEAAGTNKPHGMRYNKDM